MAITIVGTPQGANAFNGGDVTLTFDGTPAEDDVVVLFGGFHDEDDSPEVGPSTAGYTERARRQTSGEVFAEGVWTKPLGATPDTTVVGKGSGDVQELTAYMCWVLRGVDTTTPMDAVIVEFDQGSTANPDPSEITTVTDDAWVIALNANHKHPSTSFPSGYINTVTVSGTETRNIGIGGATKEIASAGAENPGTFTIQNARDTYCFTVAIRPTGGAAAGSLIIARKPLRAIIGR